VTGESLPGSGGGGAVRTCAQPCRTARNTRPAPATPSRSTSAISRRLVCIAPSASQAILAALKRQDHATAERLRAAFLPLEDCRDALNPIRTLHEAVTLSGIADMGAILPLYSNLEPQHHERVRSAALALRRFDEEQARAAA